MAILYTHKCNTCDYTVLMSGKPDQLMLGITVPAECLDCNSIYDEFFPHEPLAYNEEYDPKCPECKSKNSKVWDFKSKPCPKCKTGILAIDKSGDCIMAD